MLRKRLIGVVVVRDGWAVQSLGYRRYRPLGRPEVLVENLDRWGADEILVLSINRTRHKLGPDFDVLRRIGRFGIGTPLIYGGGISSVADAVAVIQLGADRICVDAMLHDAPREIITIAHHVGAQAVVPVFPMALSEGVVQWYDYRNRSMAPMSDEVLEVLEAESASEVLLVDWQNDGGRGSLLDKMVGEFPSKKVRQIAFGGLVDNEQVRSVLSSPRVSAIAIGNSLNYREIAISGLKHSFADLPFRPHFSWPR